jgi:DNA-3-methyladenine glycosylase II
MKPTTEFEQVPQGPFSMEPVRTLTCGFLQGTRACATQGAVRLAFPADGTFAPTGVSLTYEEETVRGRIYGGAPASIVAPQVARVLGLNHDARPFARVLEADPVLRAVSRRRPGFRPVVAYSPYAMAGWCVLCHRIRMSQAAQLQTKIAKAAGDVVEVDGEELASFPSPRSFLSRDGFPGVPEEKWRRLQAVAQAALDGELDTEALLRLPYEEAFKRLLGIRGIGAWTADGILVRGCGTTDVLPLRERTLHGAVGLAYGLGRVPDDEELAEIADSWRPFRTWVSVMLISEDFDGARQLTARRPAPAKARSASAV